MKLFFSLIFNIVFVCSLFSQKADFFSDTLKVVEGIEFYRGKEDVSAKVKIHSTGDKIIMEVEVRDDNIILGKELQSCDHVELWFALPWEEEANSKKRNLNPAYEDPSPIYYYHVDSSSKERSPIRFYSLEKGKEFPYDKNKKELVLFGQVHYGVYADNRKAHLYDRHNYSLMEKALGENIGHFQNGIQYKAEAIKTGMKYTITIAPLGLGFIRIPSMKELKFLVNVVDVDSENETTIITTAATYRPGIYSDYNDVSFSKSLKTNVTAVPDFIFDSLDFSPTVMFNAKGFWSGVTIDKACIGDLECDMAEVVYLRTPFGHKKWMMHKTEVQKFIRTTEGFINTKPVILGGGTEEVYFINKKTFRSYRRSDCDEWKFKGLKTEFMFPDGSIGLILFNIFGGYGTGGADGVVSKKMQIVKVGAKQDKVLLNVEEDDFEENTKIGDKVINSLDIENIVWSKEGSVLMVYGNIKTVGSKKYRVTFGKGDSVTVTEIKK